MDRVSEGEGPAPAGPLPLLANGGGTGGKADPAAVTKALLDNDGIAREFPDPDENEPVLRVYWNEEGHIVVEGKIRSHIQQERIIADIGEAFTGVFVKNALEIDYERIAVGWGNRVSSEFLVPFLHEVEGGFVEYREGIITLRGKANLSVANRYQDRAITVFAGPYSRDIVNEISPSTGER